MRIHQILGLWIVISGFSLLPLTSMAESMPDPYLGIRHARPAELHRLLPALKKSGAVVEFSSTFCRDCQQMKPVLHRVAQQFSAIPTYVYVMEARKNYPRAFKTFQPTTVPVLIFIQPTGAIKQVLYGLQTESTLIKGYQSLSK